MNIKLLDHAQEIRKAFAERFVMSWEEFQVKNQDWIAKMAKTNYPIGLEWYKKSFLWDRMGAIFTPVSLNEALAFVREKNDDVLFMSEDEAFASPRPLCLHDRKHIGFVAQAPAQELAALIEEEWFEEYRLLMQNMYNPQAILPEDLYVFDVSMNWCVVFTHETTDWESEIEDPKKAAESRYCMICKI